MIRFLNFIFIYDLVISEIAFDKIIFNIWLEMTLLIDYQISNKVVSSYNVVYTGQICMDLPIHSQDLLFHLIVTHGRSNCSCTILDASWTLH